MFRKSEFSIDPKLSTENDVMCENSKTKRICFLLTSHYARFIGGAEYQVKLIMDALIKEGDFEVNYLCRNASKSFRPKGYRIHIVGYSNGIYFLMR